MLKNALSFGKSWKNRPGVGGTALGKGAVDPLESGFLHVMQQMLIVCTTSTLFGKNIPTFAKHRSSLLRLLTFRGTWAIITKWGSGALRHENT